MKPTGLPRKPGSCVHSIVNGTTLRRLSAILFKDSISVPQSCSCNEFLKQTFTTSAIALCAQFAFADTDSSAQSIPAPDKSQYTLFNPTPIDLRRPYNTDRPSKTDSPYTVDAGVFQIESDVLNWTLDYEAGVRTRTWIVGNSNLKLGLTNWMDVQVFPQFL